jgi:hypothetical protein
MARREGEIMRTRLLLAGLFTAAGVAALTAAVPGPKPEPGQPGPAFPLHMTRTGVLRYTMVQNVFGRAVMAWSLQEGKDHWILRLGTQELRQKAEKLLGKKVKVKMTTSELADTLGGHVVLGIDPVEGTGAFQGDEKPELSFTQDGKDLVVSATVTVNNGSHVLWTHAVVLGKDVRLYYQVFQNRDLLVRSQKRIEVKWRLVGHKKGERPIMSRRASSPPPRS